MLQTTIEETRKKMLETAKIFGLSSKETLFCSQELDVLIHLHLTSIQQRTDS